MTKYSILNRLLSACLCIALLLSYVPGGILTANAATTESEYTKISDEGTMNAWRNFFRPADGSISTENAGGVWTDKSVFTDASAFEGTGITKDDTNSFLVALSAIGSNMSVTGMSHVPTDTMLVLDVSGSMNDDEDNNDVAEELVQAANESIATLLGANSYNRVGVVLYSGSSRDSTNNNAAILLLPLGRYTTTDNEYLTYKVSGKWETTETVSVNGAVRIEGTQDSPSTSGNSKDVTGATYIQKGLYLAMNQFVAEDNSTTVTGSTIGTVKRKPVLVLMADGEPTLATTSYKAPGQYNMGDGNNNDEYKDDPTIIPAMGFVTQLTAAYAKYKIEEKYGNDCLFYTLGLGVTGSTLATSVLNPANSTTAINAHWTSYNAAKATASTDDDNVLIYGNRYSNNRKEVTVTSEPLEQVYVDRYFSVASGTDLAQGLVDAFASIVGDIQLQSKYFPTLISESEELSGYISFVDTIGEYMHVSDVKGLLIHNTLFSGADLASNFVAGGGGLGTTENPTELGDSLIWSIKERLGISDSEVARTLVSLAYQYGQMSYTDHDNYSNYIGWYSNAAGEFLGFYHEGVTTLPTATGDAATDPAYIVRSYGYLGEVDEAHGVSKTDMMYATVRVRKDIATGEETVAFAVPAALLPLVSYNVELDNTGALKDLTVTGATEPIRLVYEVSLNEGINEFNVREVAPNAVDAEGNAYFYSNKFDVSGQVGYGTDNTYSYFYPSLQNDRYYYQSDAIIYTDTNGTRYSSTTAPQNYSGTLYRAQTIYKNNNGVLSTSVEYYPLTTAILPSAQMLDDTSNWVIPAGRVRQDFAMYSSLKAPNATETLDIANAPYVVTEGTDPDASTHNYIIGATLGNNGRLTLAPQTGIKLTKAMAAGVAAPDTAFVFTLTNTTNPADSSSYPAQLIQADGTAVDGTVTFSGGVATVSLLAGESMYIGGMTAGDVIAVTENETADYKVETSTGLENGTVTIQANTMANVSFVNTQRGTGNLTIGKVIEHDLGTDYVIPEGLEFTIQVQLTGVGTANATFAASQTNNPAVTSITTSPVGRFQITLGHNDQLELYGLPEGTEVTVTELDPAAGFTPSYWDNGVAGDGTVTVTHDNTVSVIVVNDYTPNEVYPVYMTVTGTKTLTGRDWLTDESFTLQLQKWTGTSANDPNGTWATLGETTVSGSTPSFDFKQIFGTESADGTERYTAPGTYYYRIVEINDGKGGVSYDSRQHGLVVVVGDQDMDGQLEIVSVTAGTQSTETTSVTTRTEGDHLYWDVTSAFNNTYSATDTSATVYVEKLFDNPSGGNVSFAGYTFDLYPATQETVSEDPLTYQYVIPEGAQPVGSATTGDLGYANIDLTFTKNETQDDTGIHYYILKERVPESPVAGVTYTEKQIPVQIEVKDNGNGQLTAVVTSLGIAEDLSHEQPTGDNTIRFRMVNAYDPEDATLAIDFVEKRLTGRELNANDVFTFAVIDQATGATVLTGTNDSNGKVTFNGSLTFDKVGNYYYNIVETSADGKGVTTDKTVYRYTVTVTDNGAGQLVANGVLANAAGTTAVFTNTYTTAAGSVAISGTKVLSGRSLVGSEFQFTLTQVTDATGATPVEGGTSLTAYNLADGSFTFPAITYTATGTYYYKVSEVTGALGGINYATNSYVVAVTVVDNLEGQLLATSSISGSALVFNNSYTPAPTDNVILGNKILTGKTLNEGMFRFELFESNANWEQGANTVDARNNAATGEFAFGSIRYTETGTWYYLVKEQYGGQVIKGVTYDDSVFRVRVEIRDDQQKGQLYPVVTIWKYDGVDALPVDAIVFNNAYGITDDGQAVINGTKTLSGRELAADEFTFELYETAADFSTAGITPATVTNAADGSFSFVIPYTAQQLGTHYYVVKEQTGTLGGVGYANTEYYVTVDVADNGEGGIATTTVITTSTDTETKLNGVTFANTYTTEPTSITLEGKKVLDGKVLNEGEFTFKLYSNTAGWQMLEKLGEVTNKADGTFAFEDIPLTKAGTYYFIVEEDSSAAAAGVAYDKSRFRVVFTVVDDGQGTLYVDANSITYQRENAGVTTDASDGIVFNNTYVADAVSVQLHGTKNLQNTGNTQQELVRGTYGFELYQYGENWTGTPTFVERVYNLVDGKFTFSTLIFQPSQTGTYYYTIVERNAGQTINGVTHSTQEYKVKITVTDTGLGYMTAVKEINGNVDGAITFTNVYDVADTSVTFSGTKSLTGRELAAGEFSFELYATDSTFAVAAGAAADQTVTNTADGAFSFAAIPYTAEDVGKTFYYVVKETKNGLGGVEYDGTQYRITVVVADNGDGTIGTTVTMTDAAGAAKTAIAFANSYTAALTSAQFAGTKTLKNASANTHQQLAAGAYSFGLYDSTGALLQTVTNAADGTFTFAAIPYSAVGEYTYQVKEIPGTAGGISYDGTVYNIKVNVTDPGDGQLVAAVTVNDIANGAIAFTNTYSVTEPESITLTGTKTLTGRALKDGEFSFELYRTEGGVAVPDSKQVVANKGAGFAFTLSYNATDIGKTYTYIVKETNAGSNKNGVAYSETVYNITVAVSDNGDGTIKLTSVITNGTTSATVTSMDFTNSYTAQPARVDLSGKKTLNALNSDHELAAGDFAFDLYESNTSWAEGKRVGHVENMSDGTFAFEQLVFEKAGTYYYVVKENVETPQDGIGYDTNRYHIVITVTDPGDGQLVAAKPVITKVSTTGLGTAASAIEFTNTHNAADTSISFSGTKTLSNKALANGMFHFSLYHSNEAGVQGTRMETVDNRGDSFYFAPIVYSATGTHYYLIKEEYGGQTIDGITYDAKTYHIKVEVNDDLINNHLVAVATLADGSAADKAAIAFDNQYNITTGTSVTFSGTKTLTGRALKAGEFTFELYTTESDFATDGLTAQNTANAADGKFSFTVDYTPDSIGTHYYVVKETKNGLGGVKYDTAEYHITVVVADNGIGGITATTTIVKGQTEVTNVDFANSYTAAPTSTDLTGEKILKVIRGQRELKAGEFTFELYHDDANWNRGDLIDTVTNAADGTFTFEDIALNTAGVHHFAILEADNGQAGIGYDGHHYHVTVYVTDPGDGQLKVDRVQYTFVDANKAASNADKIVFTNTYTAEDASVQFEGAKYMTGDREQLLTGETYSFELYATNSDWTLESSAQPIETVSNAQDGSFSFSTITYEKVGTWYYLIMETPVNENGVDSDPTVYRVTVTVSDDHTAGTLVAQYDITDANDAEKEVFAFTNTYEITGTDDVIFKGVKYITGDRETLLENEKYTFELYETGADFKVEGITPITTQNAADGSFSFTKTYGKNDIGTHYYVIKEQAVNANGVTSSTVKYEFTVMVEDNNKGGVAATVEGGDVSKVDFTNTYTITDTDTVTFSGIKTVTGDREALLENEKYTFELYETGADFKVEGITPITTQNAADGTFSFTKTYDKDDIGTHYYVIKEQAVNANGVTSSTVKYEFTVKVEDNNKGGVTATVEGGDVSKVDFVNTYTAKPAEITFEGTKTLTGDRDLTEGDFTFVLYETGEDFAIGGEGMLAQNNAGVKVGSTSTAGFVFETVELAEAKIYHFVILESSTDAINGVTYDNSKYRITVTVEDNNSGNLEITDKTVKRITDEGTDTVEKITFANSYDAKDATYKLEGHKDLFGRDPQQGEFRFQLHTANSDFVINREIDPEEALNDGGDFSFTLTFDKAQTYYYVVSELDTQAEDVVYDDTVYQVAITVVDNDGTLEVSDVDINKFGGTDPVEAMVFTNYYVTPATVTLNVNKTVENKGTSQMGPGGFRFILTKEGDAPGKVTTATSDADGLAGFTLLFTEEDIGKVYNYTIEELDENKPFVTYSTVVHTLSVRVVLNPETGELETVLTLNGEPVQQVQVEFINQYTHTPPPDTADSSNLVLWYGLLVLSMSCLAVTVLYEKKQREEEL